MEVLEGFHLGVELEKYSKNFQNAYYDPIRGILLKANPEEEVRIKFIHYLINVLNTPSEMIKTEFPVSFFKKGTPGRIDILGFYYDTIEKKYNPLFIVECKAPHVVLTDKVLKQAQKYSQNLPSVKYIILTNGIDTFYYVREGEKFLGINNIVTYTNMLKPEDCEFDYYESSHLNYNRLTMDEISASLYKKSRPFEWGWIGEGTPKTHYKYLLNLIGLFYDYHQSLSFPIVTNKFKIIEDGYRYTSFGNAAGGGWPGEYRYFLIEDNNHQNQVISISIMGKVYENEDPRFPNSNGHTIFIVAVDDFDKSHNSLQLDLDKFVEKSWDKIIIWHDGTTTAGKSGRLKNSIVLQYIKENAPELIKNGRLELGELPYNKFITWEDAEKFIVNCIRYALLRDEIRDLLRNKQ